MQKKISFLNYDSFQQEGNTVFQLAKSGNIGIFPTDTVYGIGVRADFQEGYNKIYKIKRRSEDKPLPLVIGSWEQFYKIIKKSTISSLTSKILNKWWPGPLTVIFKISNNTLALRFPDHKILCKIIETIGEPLALTSANLSGDKSPIEIENISNEIIEQVDFIIDTGICKYKKESTIIDWEGNIIREGAVTIDDLRLTIDN